MKTSRKIPSINAGSMADIAFLLLIFFLVSTEIYDDRGLSVTLPAYYDGPVGQMAERNVCVIRINADNQVLLEGKIINVSMVKDQVKDFIMNRERSANRPASPEKAVVSLQHDPEINYKMYMKTYAEVKAAYRELYDEHSVKVFGGPFSALSNEEKNKVRKAIPLKISEAEYKI